MEIGLVGGTGPAGRAMALRLASVGFDVVLGSRSRYRAMEARDELLARYPDRDLAIRSGDNVEAAGCELVVIATPWEAAPEVASSVAKHLNRKVVICMSNALAKVAGEFQPLVPPRGSVSANVQAMVPGAYVVAAMHHVPAIELGAIDDEVHSDVLICSDHPWAIETVSRLVDKIPGARPLDAGRLSNATAIEAFTAVMLQLNTRYKTRVALRFLGIDD
jgi:NADPH-dependent F420 reductase